jgi:hypothetical protein
VLDPGWEHAASLDELRTYASDLLDDSFPAARSDSGVIAWKDPRLSLVLPFWRTVAPIATTIVMVRDPAQVAASLRARNGIEAPQASILWLRYLFAATANDPDHLLLRDRDFFEDLPTTLAEIATHLGVRSPSRDAIVATRGHLDPSLRHHVDVADAPTDNPLVALAARVWNEGSVDMDAVPDVVADGIRWGWIRPPIDGELLARARAQAVELRDRIRRRRRQERAAQSSPPNSGPHAESSPVSVAEGSSRANDGEA